MSLIVAIIFIIMKYAPFAVPTLCRSDHFIRMIESLKKNSWAHYTDVIVGVDFPPSEKYKTGWEKILGYLDSGDFSVFNKLIVFRQTENIGAQKNGQLLKQYIEQHYDRWIYCDDDCEFSPNFLEYMDKCLDAFENDPDVVAVTGYSYPLEWAKSESATCMKQQFNAATWGVGRWVNKSKPIAEYIQSGTMLDDARMVIMTGRYRKMVKKCFSQYITASSTGRDGVVKGLMTGVTDLSLRAYLACQDKYCISPMISKVRNYGFDGTGLYCQNSNGTDSSNALNYYYHKQKIDNSDKFNIILNDPNLHECNRKKLDNFERVSKSTYCYTYFKSLIIRFFGLNFTRKMDRTIVFVLKTFKLKE